MRLAGSPVLPGGPDYFLIGSVIRPDVRSFIGPLAKILPAVINYPVVGFAYGGEQCAISQLKAIQRVAAERIRFLVLILDAVNSNADNPVAAIPAPFNFMLYPFATCRLGPDQNGRDARILELTVNPSFDFGIAFFLDRFPFGRVDKPVFIFIRNYIAVPYLAGAPCVTFIVEAEKDFPSHQGPLFSDTALISADISWLSRLSH